VPTFGSSRRRLGEILNAAFAEGLLSEQTHAHRVATLYETRLIDRERLVGDLTLRTKRQPSSAPIRQAWNAFLSRLRARIRRQPPHARLLLSLEDGHCERLLIGRHPRCDVVLTDLTVSREHALLTFRDGLWMLQDLASTNGTAVNGARIVRTSLRSGDIVALGGQAVQID
jgi:hypothetical protein